MRPSRRGGLVAVSLALHLAALAAISPIHRTLRPRLPSLHLVELTVTPRAQVVPPVTPSVAPSRSPAARSVGRRRAPIIPSPSPSSPSSLDEESAPPPARVDLFPSLVLGGLVAAPVGGGTGWGGRTRREGDGQPAPLTADPAGDREAAGERVRRWTSELRGEERVSSGRVAPGWRDVERGIEARYQPDADAVSTKTKLQETVGQLRAGLRTPPSSEPTRRDRDSTIDSGNNHEMWTFRTEQINAAHDHYNRPGEWRRSEIEAIVDENGLLVEANVVAVSGRRVLDRQALDAVRRAVAERSVRDPLGRVRLRFALEAAVSVNLPMMTPIVDPTTGVMTGIIGGISGVFDEVLGTAKVNTPGERVVHRRVALLSVEPVDGAPTVISQPGGL